MIQVAFYNWKKFNFFSDRYSNYVFDMFFQIIIEVPLNMLSFNNSSDSNKRKQLWWVFVNKVNWIRNWKRIIW